MTSFDTYENSKSKLPGILAWYSIIGLLCIILIAISKPNGVYLVILLTIGLSGVFVLFAMIWGRNDFWNNINRIGKIEFHENHFDTLGQKFNYSDLQNVHIYYAGYAKSKTQIHVYNTGNYIEFTYNDMAFKILFLVDSENERQNLSKLLKSLNQKGVNFKETTSRGKSYFLDINLNYNEIQELSKKYNI